MIQGLAKYTKETLVLRGEKEKMTLSCEQRIPTMRARIVRP